MYSFLLAMILTIIIGFMSQRLMLSLSITAESMMERKAHWNAVAGNAIGVKLEPTPGTAFNFAVDHDGTGGWDQIEVNGANAVGSHGVEIKSTISR